MIQSEPIAALDYYREKYYKLEHKFISVQKQRDVLYVAALALVRELKFTQSMDDYGIASMMAMDRAIKEADTREKEVLNDTEKAISRHDGPWWY